MVLKERDFNVVTGNSVLFLTFMLLKLLFSSVVHL